MATATDTQKNLLHRSALAYVGLYGLAYDRISAYVQTNCLLASQNGKFDDLVEKGEVVEKQAEVLFKESRIRSMKRYASAAEFIETTASSLGNFLPLGRAAKVEAMEAEIEKLTAKLDEMTKAAQTNVKKTTAKKTTKKATTKAKTTTKKVVKATAEVTADAAAAIVDAADTVIEKVETPEVQAAPTIATTTTAAAKKEPRHIPYYIDVKRYDPLADEDIVRKIVNHCGIALRSEDARYVACSDESERTTVRESWLKRKLGLEASDTDLDKKVLEVCSIMQRDQRKNRVTFYYLLAKKERKLTTL